jgi:sterol 14alpha-demethylase
MGLVNEVAAPLAEAFHGLGTASQVAIVIAAAIILTVVLNVANQLLFRNPNEPPVVFHWFPFFGSTVTYGMDPPVFFRAMRQKVHPTSSCGTRSAQPADRVVYQ